MSQPAKAFRKAKKPRSRKRDREVAEAAELREFLEDDAAEDAEPGFRERLREECWQILQRTRGGDTSDS